MSNFHLIDAPDKQPAVDYLTRSSVGPFIDTGRDAPAQSGRGLDRIYISIDTLRHMADVAGILDKPSNTALEEAYRRGVLDGVRENVGPDLVRIADAFDRWLVDVRDVDRLAGVPQAG